jgi:hypothetical protein
MMRLGCVVVCGIALVGSLIGIALGVPLYALTIISGLLLLGLVFERFVYQPLRRGRPGAGWQVTPERFVDPSSGKLVTVWFNAAKGERRYVADGDPPLA